MWGKQERRSAGEGRRQQCVRRGKVLSASAESFRVVQSRLLYDRCVDVAC